MVTSEPAMTIDRSAFLEPKTRVRARLVRRLRTEEIVDVFGVVDPSGVSAGKSQGERLCTVLIELSPWCVRGKALRRSQLVVFKQVSERAMESLRARMDPYDVVHVRARIGDEYFTSAPYALLHQVVGKDTSDTKLAECARVLQVPVRFKDAQFGTFVLDRRVNWFVAKTMWDGTAVQLGLTVDDPADVRKVCGRARELWKARKTWERKAREMAAADLLESYNKAWRQDDPVLDGRRFMKAMRINSVSVDRKGSVSYCFDMGDLFGGHAIMVDGDLATGPKRVDLIG